MKKKKYQAVLITWIDSKGITSEWEFEEDVEPLEPAICYTVGYLIDDKKKYKTVCQSYGNEQIIGRMAIPSCSIIKIKKLKP